MHLSEIIPSGNGNGHKEGGYERQKEERIRGLSAELRRIDEDIEALGAELSVAKGNVDTVSRGHAALEHQAGAQH